MAQITRNPDYSDLDLDFLAHPNTGAIVIKRGNEAIKRSVRNLILTNFYDRPFQPQIGSNAHKLLFENATPLTSIFLKDAIREVLKNYEPRIELKDVAVVFNIDNNAYNVTLNYIILNRSEPITQTLFLERVR